MLAVAPAAVTQAYAANVVEPPSRWHLPALCSPPLRRWPRRGARHTQNITVFAPTDEAFAALPAGTVEDLLKPENKDKLAAILQLHVPRCQGDGRRHRRGSTEVDTLNPNAKLTVTQGRQWRHVAASNSAKVTAADVAADNGVIHVIDAVLLP